MTRYIASLMLAASCLVASANEYQFYSSSTRSSSSAQLDSRGLTLRLEQTPLIDALKLIGDTYRVPVQVEECILPRLEKPVSTSGSGLSLEAALGKVLDPSQLCCVIDGKGGVIVTEQKMTWANASQMDLVSLRRLAIEQVLKKQVPLMLFHTPLEMGLQMAQGFAGVTIEIDRVAIRNAGIDLYQPVSVEGGNLTLAQSLDAMLKPLGLTYQVTDNGILVTTKTR